MKKVVTVENLIETIRFLNPRLFGSFHLSVCFCGLPMWKQPCAFCGYYPDWSDHKSPGGDYKMVGKKENFWGNLESFKKQMAGRSIFDVFIKDRMKCCCPVSIAEMEGLYVHVKLTHVWPTDEGLWAAFGSDVPKGVRSQYDLSEEKRLELYLAEAKASVAFYEYLLANPGLSYGKNPLTGTSAYPRHMSEQYVREGRKDITMWTHKLVEYREKHAPAASV